MFAGLLADILYGLVNIFVKKESGAFFYSSQPIK